MNKFLLLLATLALTTSCMKKLAETDDDGPVASAEEVNQAIIKAWGGTDDPREIKKDEFVYTEREQRVQSQAPLLILQEGTSVTKREVDGEAVNYTLIVQTNEITNDESKLSTRERNIRVGPEETKSLSIKGTDLSTKASGDNTVKPLALSVENMHGARSLCFKDDNWDVTCHNLSYTEEVQPAPDLVKQQPNCAGLPNCQIRIRRVEFDLVLNSVEENGTTAQQKIKYNLGFSPDVPYLARLIDNCRRGLVMVPAAGQKILVDICDKVKNFKVGQ